MYNIYIDELFEERCCLKLVAAYRYKIRKKMKINGVVPQDYSVMPWGDEIFGAISLLRKERLVVALRSSMQVRTGHLSN
jgi:hypothetical protein